MSPNGMVLRHLVFTGIGVNEVRLSFSRGLNIIYGASNTGKSFTAKALRFMLAGTSSLPQPEQLNPYSEVWLGLSMPDGNDVTLCRSTRGGDFRLFQGLVSSDIGASKPLLGSAQANRADTVSHFLLDSIGWSGKVIVRNAHAEKENLAIRHVLPYVIVAEGDIMSETDPVHHSRQHANRTLESNLLRFVLTGVDDRAAVTGISKKNHRIATKAKIELIDEMIAQIDDDLGEDPPGGKELDEQFERLSASLLGLQDKLLRAQNRLDSLVSRRRHLLDKRREISSQVLELTVTQERFARLDETYSSDRARLEALEEGGLVLRAMADRECPVCGAPPNAQRHHHAIDEIGLAHRAAVAEARKIAFEQRDLKRTIVSLRAEGARLHAMADDLANDVAIVESEIERMRPEESSARSEYARLAEKRAEVQRIIELFGRRDRLVVRRSQIDSTKPGQQDSKLSVGIDGTTAFALGKTIAAVLDRWNFPGADQVQFDLETSDITIGGKPRSDNGKGVRAILHAAFNVGLLLYCRENELAHPGFLVLDTPLLTYREPLKSRHGELSEDESRIKNSPVALSFYDHLTSLKDFAQIIVLENADPPEGIDDEVDVQVFTGQRDTGRYGLFPPVIVPS